MLLGWSVMHVQRTKCKKCEKEGEAYTLRWKSSKMRARLNHTECEGMVVYQDDHALFFASLDTVALLLIGLDVDFMALRLHFRAVFFIFAPASSVFFFAPITTFAIWRHDNETTSAATALRKINLCMCIQLFGAFLSMTNCIPEAWQHTPPTENMHCKISSLALRHSARTFWIRTGTDLYTSLQ